MNQSYRQVIIGLITGTIIAGLLSATIAFASPTLPPSSLATGTATSGYVPTSTGTTGFASWQALPSTSGFVPYTGATGNVDLGTYTISAPGSYSESENFGNLSATDYNHATAIGYHAVAGYASGVNSIAIGDNTQSGFLSAVIGSDSQSVGNGNIIIGDESSVNGNGNFIIGSLISAGSVSDAFLLGNGTSAGGGGMVIGNSSSAGGEGVVIGNSSSAGGESVVVGPSANDSGSQNILMGFESEAAGNQGVAVGVESEAAGNAETAIGYDSDAGAYSNSTVLGWVAYDNGDGLNDGTGQYSVTIGDNSIGTENSVVIGSGAQTTATSDVLLLGANLSNSVSQQAVIGDGYNPITNFVFSQNPLTASPVNVTFNPSGASGTNVAGTDTIWQAGNGTGTGGSGEFRIQTAHAGSSGSTADTMTDALEVNSSGNIGIGAAASATNLLTFTQAVATTGSPNLMVVTGGAHTTLTASTEATDVNFNLARTVQFATGALTTQRAFLIQAPTYGFVGASTITTASTFDITGAPIAGTHATITNAYALNVESGVSNFGGNVNLGTNKVLFDGSGGVQPYMGSSSGQLTLEPGKVTFGTGFINFGLFNDTATYSSMIIRFNTGTAYGQWEYTSSNAQWDFANDNPGESMLFTPIIALYDASENYLTYFKTGTQSGNITYTLPIVQGAASTTLVNNGSGLLSWSPISQIVGNARMTGLTAAQALTTYTVGASDTTYMVSMNINVTASTLNSFTAVCAYTDETNTSRALTMQFSNTAGTLLTTITNALGVGAYEGVPLQIRAKAGSTIICGTASGGTYTTVTYNEEERIIQN